MEGWSEKEFENKDLWPLVVYIADCAVFILPPWTTMKSLNQL